MRINYAYSNGTSVCFNSSAEARNSAVTDEPGISTRNFNFVEMVAA